MRVSSPAHLHNGCPAGELELDFTLRSLGFLLLLLACRCCIDLSKWRNEEEKGKKRKGEENIKMKNC